MFIIERGTTPNGTHIQIENWHDTYNFIPENATIGFYPLAANDVYNENNPHFPAYPKRGETFRASLEFDTEEEARKVFDALKSGEKTYLHFLDNYKMNTISKDNFIKAVTN